METKEYLQRLIEISSKKLSLMDEIMMFTKTQNEVIRIRGSRKWTCL